MADVPESLEDLKVALGNLRFPLPDTSAVEGRKTAASVLHQIGDYLLPRYESLEAPLLAVVGGSTGSGKSLLVNSLVRAHVARSSAIRPTTRNPLLVFTQVDAPWFTSSRILPDLSRVSGIASGKNEVEIVSSDQLPPGLALLDSPDIDSVVDDNRVLAAQLLAAADLWVFVTTAARYSDAIPWALLREASSRNIVLGIVLNRMPPGTQAQILPDLRRRLDAEGLADAPIFPIAEQQDKQGFIPRAEIQPLRTWLDDLAADAASRAAVARRTLAGATEALLARESTIVDALDDQALVAGWMSEAATRAFEGAQSSMEESLRDGSLLRSEVVARWQEIVGTGEWMRRLERGVSTLRDRVVGWFRTLGPEPTVGDVDQAIEDSLLTTMVACCEDAIAQTQRQWGAGNATEEVLREVKLRTQNEREEAAAELIRLWQRDLLEMVSTVGRDKKATARLLAVGVNVVGAALIVVIFASTAGLTGAEVAVAGGTALAAQRVLEAVFGDDAVRQMTNDAKADLLARTQQFFDQDRAPFLQAVTDLQVDPESGKAVAARFQAVRESVHRSNARSHAAEGRRP